MGYAWVPVDYQIYVTDPWIRQLYMLIYLSTIYGLYMVLDSATACHSGCS